MSDSLPPDHRPPRLRDDEQIALLVVFLVFGAILTWVFGQGRDRWDVTETLSQWKGAFTTPAAPSPSPNPVESAIAALTGSPTLGTPNLGTPGLGALMGGATGASGSSPVTSPIASVPSPDGASAPPAPNLSAGSSTQSSPQPLPSPGATGAPLVVPTLPTPSAAPSPTPTSPLSGLPASPSPTFPNLGQASPPPQTMPSQTMPSPTMPSPTMPSQTMPSPTMPSQSAKPSAIAFADVPQTYWAAPFIIALADRGIISGFEDGRFKPNQPVTRAQFAVQVQKAFTKPDRQPPQSFTDVPPGSYWSTAVDNAVKANFMRGYPEGDFRPEQPVSRSEAVASLVQGLGIPEPADPEAILQPYRDRNQVPPWARGRVAAAIQRQLFSGDPDTQLLQPNQPASRADIAALIYKGMEASQSP